MGHGTPFCSRPSSPANQTLDRADKLRLIGLAMRRLPPLSAVRAFEAAARTENFTAAAAELGLTQAAVSYQVKALEERLGAALFVREKGRARLTPLGQRLLPTLSQAFDSIEAAFASHRAEDESLLTVTTTHTFANTWLAWRLGGFQMEHPDLAVRMTTSNEIVDLRSGEADVAIRAGRGDWPGLEVHKLMELDFTPMASPECIAKFERDLGRKLEPADLSRPAADRAAGRMVDALVPRRRRAARQPSAARRDPPRQPGQRRPCGDGRAGLRAADAVPVARRRRQRPAGPAVRADLDRGLCLLACLSARAAHGAQGQALPRVAAGGRSERPRTASGARPMPRRSNAFPLLCLATAHRVPVFNIGYPMDDGPRFAITALGADDVALMHAMLTMFGEAFDEVETMARLDRATPICGDLLGSDHVHPWRRCEDGCGGRRARGLRARQVRARAQRDRHLRPRGRRAAIAAAGIATALIEELEGDRAGAGAYVIFIQATRSMRRRSRFIRSLAGARTCCTSTSLGLSGTRKYARPFPTARIPPPMGVRQRLIAAASGHVALDIEVRHITAEIDPAGEAKVGDLALLAISWLPYWLG